MSPLGFLQRLAALVPLLRPNLIRYFGVLAPNAKWRGQEVLKATEEADAGGWGYRMPWARLLKRVFKIDVEHCPHYGGQQKIISAIEDPATIGKILRHLGLPARAPPREPAQYPAFLELA